MGWATWWMSVTPSAPSRVSGCGLPRCVTCKALSGTCATGDRAGGQFQSGLCGGISADTPFPQRRRGSGLRDCTRGRSGAVAEEALRDDVIGAPEMLGIDGITADAISLRLTVAVRANAQWAVERELRRRILIAFDENGIRPLYLDGLSSGTVETLEKASR